MGQEVQRQVDQFPGFLCRTCYGHGLDYLFNLQIVEELLALGSHRFLFALMKLHEMEVLHRLFKGLH